MAATGVLYWCALVTDYHLFVFLVSFSQHEPKADGTIANSDAAYEIK
jgi:hypothetical protein